ncbi:MAG: molecular chaperone HtpG, partial [Candidatus Margulisbacteria bacterium]|nr:molecular chaperone HtpG [Candidatus Margulisiibacteriota bacterium]
MITKEKEQFEFKTEVKQLLDLVIHSLYSHKDIFLRELISNAADAVDRFRFESLTNQDLLEDNADWKIKIIPNEKSKTLTISDNGTGMSHEELIEHLGTIAKSGTKEFMQKIKDSKSNNALELIGQFGVGFYASFMVADKVTVITRKAKAEKAYKWISQGEGGFEIEEAEKTQRGTEVILHLKKEDYEYLQEDRIREIIKKYSDFIEHPIVMDVEKEEYPKDKEGNPDYKAKPTKKIEEEILNSRKAIWAKAKNEVSPEEYKEFYKHIAHDFNDPCKTIHYSAEGTSEFKALLYFPSKAPLDIFYREKQKGLQLYVKRVFIMDDPEALLPQYLRFVKGVVDSSDLPLNVSREILQQDAQLGRIKKNLVNKILNTLKEMKEKEYEEYVKFYKEFGPILKEGLHTDYEYKEKLADLLLFETTKTTAGKFRTLEQYVQEMFKDQKDIFYITGEKRVELEASPHLEAFKKKNWEVLFMTDPIDEWIVNDLLEYNKKHFKPINKGEIDLRDQKQKEESQEKQEQYKNLLELMKKKLINEVKEVRFTSRLTDSASCLVDDEQAMSEQMLRM